MALRIASGQQLGDTYVSLLKAAATTAQRSDNHNEEYDIGVDELIMLDPETTLRMQVDALCERWQTLDRKYLKTANMNKGQHLNVVAAEDEDKVPGCFNHLAVPLGKWLSDLAHPERCIVDDPTYSHPRIPEEYRVRSIPVDTCQYLSIPVDTCQYLSIPVNTCQYLSIPVNTCQYLPSTSLVHLQHLSS
jgi:hypothetical protein